MTSTTRPAARAAASAPSADGPSPDVRAPLDEAIAQLRTGSEVWSRVTLGQRARLLESLRATVVAQAAVWAETAADSKGLETGHPLRGEEWQSGPYAAIVAIDAYTKTLRALAEGRSPAADLTFGAAPGGRLRARVFPASGSDRLLLSGFTGEVWFEPGTTADTVRSTAGLGQLHPETSGGVGLVLGAGNVTSIPVLDVLHELIAHNRVTILKLNPTQDALLPVFRRALAPLIEPGFLHIVRGDGEVGAFLTGHSGVDHVHITGSATTFDAIVWGHGAAGARRRCEGRPVLRTPITAELGGVSPIIVVPGVWSAADLRFHAEHIATMRLHNAGNNCIAGQVVVVGADWPQREAFLAALRAAYARAPQRPGWYPRVDEKLAGAASDYPAAVWSAGGSRALIELGTGPGASALESTEYFAPVLGVVGLPGDGQEFLDAAVAYANERLVGTLGANVVVDPTTEAALGDGFERAIADLRYGSIAINAWTGFAFLTPTLTWGAFPGETPDAIRSGIGTVHNALLLDHAERSVLRGPFRPFPRSLSTLGSRRGVFSVLPKPPWFVTSRTGAAVSEGFTRFRMHADPVRLAGTMIRAFRA